MGQARYLCIGLVRTNGALTQSEAQTGRGATMPANTSTTCGSYS